MAPPKLYTRRSAMRASQASVQPQVGDKDLKAAAKTNIQPAPQMNGKLSSRQADVKPAKRANEEVQQAVDTSAMRVKKKRRIEVEVVSEGSPSPVAAPAPASAVQTKGGSLAQASSTSRVANSRRGDGATATPTVHTSETQGKKAALSIQKKTSTPPHENSSSAFASTLTNGARRAATAKPSSHLRRMHTSPPEPMQTSVTHLKGPSPSKASRSSTPTPMKANKPSPMDVDTLPKPAKKAPSASRATASRPKTRARDLSSLFSACLPSSSQPNSAAPSPTKVAKRMLGRSKTESSISTASASIFDSPSGGHKNLGVAGSMPNILGGPSEMQVDTPKARDRSPTANRGPLDDSPPRKGSAATLPAPKAADADLMKPPTQPGKTLRTYAGASRSFLMAIPLSAASDPTANPTGAPLDLSTLAEPAPADDAPDSVPYATLHALYLPAEDDNMMNPLLKSITDLRSKGEARRWADEAGYLLEGLEPGAPVGLRRASALDIAKKLAEDAGFWEKARRADEFFGTVWERFVLAGAGAVQVKEGDAFMDALLVAFVALVSRDEEALAELANQAEFCEVLFRVMARARNFDVFIEQEGQLPVKLSKKEKAFVVSVKDTLSPHLANICDSERLSTCALVTQILGQLSPSCLPPSRASDLIQCLRSCLSAAQPNIFATHSTRQLGHLLSLLDSYLLGRWGSSGSSSTSTAVLDNEEWLVPALLGLLCDASASPKSKGKARASAESDAKATLPNLTLRILTTLTHASQPWCRRVERADGVHKLGSLLRACVDSGVVLLGRTGRSVVKQESDKASDDKADGREDTLYITLALLTNLAQELGACKGVDDGVIDILLRLHASSSVRGARVNGTDQGDATAAAREAERIYVPGHLAVLLGMLMRSSDAVRASVLRALEARADGPDLKANDDEDTAACGVRWLADDAKAFVHTWVYAVGAAQNDRGRADGQLATEVLAFYETLL